MIPRTQGHSERSPQDSPFHQVSSAQSHSSFAKPWQTLQFVAFVTGCSVVWTIGSSVTYASKHPRISNLNAGVLYHFSGWILRYLVLIGVSKYTVCKLCPSKLPENICGPRRNRKKKKKTQITNVVRDYDCKCHRKFVLLLLLLPCTFSSEPASNILFQFVKSLLYTTLYASTHASPVLVEEIPLVMTPVITLRSVKST